MPVEVDTRKAIALLAYLAITRQVHSREELAALLWPEYDNERALANLRRTLWSLNKAVGKTRLNVDQESVGLNRETGFWLDVEAFHNHLAACQSHAHAASDVCPACLSPLTTAATLYRDDFMAGFTLRDSPNFDEWQFFQTESLRSELAGVLERLVTCHIARGEFEQAITYARRWLALDPLSEPVHRQLMQLYDWAGHRSAALRQYNECVSLLEEEFGLTPEMETTALYQAIREKRAPAPPTGQRVSVSKAAITPAAPHPGLSTPATDVHPATDLPQYVTDPTPLREDSGRLFHHTPVTPEQRQRYNMLKTVHTFWIQGVLENSLHGAMLLELGMKQEVDAVDHPWDTLLRMPGSPDRTLPPGTTILNVFDKLNGKLLILGDPGSGKTTTLLELARDLLIRAGQDEAHPIPVIFNFSSWSQDQKPLVEWLVDELEGKYQAPRIVAEEWVKRDALLLLLDGLDEIADHQRGACIQAINTYRQEHGFVDVVVCSRIADYQTLSTKLKLNGAIVLQPLTDVQLDAYLARLGPNMGGVRALLTADTTLRQMCQSPLMLNMVVLAYHGTSVTDTLELDTLEAQRKRLFEVYVQRMLEERIGPKPYPPEQTAYYLSWLARQMMEYGLTVFRVEDLKPKWLKTFELRQRYRVSVAWVIGLVDGLIVGTATGLPAALVYGPGSGLAVGLGAMVGWWVASGLAVKLGVGLSVGEWTAILSVTAAAALGTAILKPLGAMVMALAIGLIAGFTPGDEVAETELKTTPQQGLRQATQRAIRTGLVSSIIAGLVAGLVAGLAEGPVAGVGSGLVVGLMIGPIAATLSASSRAVIRHYVLRFLLHQNQYIPQNYVRLLDYAVRLIFLRRVGSGYIFIHRYLLEYFAGLEQD
jgi:DNA-binding SARP family transcriptional activator